MTTAKRIEWIDIAKGVGIALVSFGHLSNGEGENVWLPALGDLIAAIYLFHMPLFYFLGGITFSMRGGWRSFVIRKIRTLLVPYYFFSLYFLAKPFAVLLIPSLSETFHVTQSYDVLHQFYDVLINGNGLWFLMAFFIGELIMYYIIKSTKQNRKAIFIIGFALIIFYRFIVNTIPDFQLPFQVINGINVAGFMCLGYVSRSQIEQVTRNKGLTLALVTLLMYAISTFLYINCFIPLCLRQVVSVLAALSGSQATIFFCITLHHNSTLAKIGKNSVVYYALNAITLNVLKLIVFKLLSIDISLCPAILQLIIGILIMIASLILLSIENIFVQKYLWWSIGKKQQSI